MKSIMILLLILSVQVALSASVTGNVHYSATFEGSETQITVGDVTVNAQNDAFVVDGKEYNLGTTWAFFGLTPEKEYSIRTWQTVVNCGCYQQTCGHHCPEGDVCVSANMTSEPLFCYPGTARKGFCASLVNTGHTQSFTVYQLNHISTVAFALYGGPIPLTSVSPGFTIKNSYKGQNYAFNAMISKITPRKQIDLSKYRYAESEGRVITVEEFQSIDLRPDFAMNFDKASCPEDGKPSLNTSFVKKSLVNVENNNFHAYTILRKAKTLKKSTLAQVYLLTPNGVREWDEKSTFTFLDPCNQQFLTLQKEESGSYIVKAPESQKPISENIFCIAISDVPSTQYDLVLYEITNGGTVWSASDRFVGLLSQDYLDKIQLTVTTSINPMVKLTEAAVTVSIDGTKESPILKFTTEVAMSCQVFVSPTCNFNLTTNSKMMLINKPLSNCGSLYEVGGYTCEGISGSFFPPGAFVQSPISGWTENTPVQDMTIHTVVAVNPPDNKTLGGWLLTWIKRWTRSNWVDKLTSLIMIIGFFILLVFLVSKLVKPKVYEKLPDKDDEEEQIPIKTQKKTKSSKR